MKSIHVLRRPCSEGTVAANVLKYGTGALNIDAARIGTTDVVQTHSRSPEASRKENRPVYGEYGSLTTHQTPGQCLGRGPANLILDGGDEVVRLFPSPHGAGCARVGSSNPRVTEAKVWQGPATQDTGKMHRFGDTGSAARFFKQFAKPSTSNTGSHMNTELADYLRTMISPEDRTLTTTEGGACVYLHIADPDSFPWADHTDASVHGMTVEARSVTGQAVWLPEAYRVLKPGAHLLLAAPDDEPVGYTGACTAEDLGFEVRDCILWVYGEGAGDRLHYTAKAARSEREEGLFDGAGTKQEPSYVLKAGLAPEVVAEVNARLLETGLDPELVAAL